jgi:hypothetical protein
MPGTIQDIDEATALEVLNTAIDLGFKDPDMAVPAWLAVHEKTLLPVVAIVGSWFYVDPILAATKNTGWRVVDLISAFAVGFSLPMVGYRSYRDFVLQSFLPGELRPYARDQRSVALLVSQIFLEVVLAAVAGVAFDVEAYSDNTMHLSPPLIFLKTLFAALGSVYINIFPVALFLRDPFFRIPFSPIVWIGTPLHRACLAEYEREKCIAKEHVERAQEQKVTLFLNNFQRMLNQIRLKPLEQLNGIALPKAVERKDHQVFLEHLLSVTDDKKADQSIEGLASTQFVWLLVGAMLVAGYAGFYVQTYSTFSLFDNAGLQWGMTAPPCVALAILAGYFGGKGVQGTYVFLADRLGGNVELPLPLQLYGRQYAVTLLLEFALGWFSSVMAERVADREISGEMKPFFVVCATISAKIFAMSMLYRYVDSLHKGVAYQSKDTAVQERARIDKACEKVYQNVSNLAPEVLSKALDGMRESFSGRLLRRKTDVPLLCCGQNLYKPSSEGAHGGGESLTAPIVNA